jgi:hypothetical protein
MESQNRIVDRNWAHYDFRNVVFEPKNMSRQELKKGHDWVLRGFYSVRSISRRLARELLYLSPATIARAAIPLNLGYRTRLSADGTFGGVLV